MSKSTYHVACICGAPIISHCIEGICSGCSRGFRLDWQAPVSGSVEPPSITEKYEEGK